MFPTQTEQEKKDNTLQSRTMQAARTLIMLFQSPAIPIYLVMTLLFSLPGFALLRLHTKLYLLGMVVLYAMMLPMILSWLLVSMRRIRLSERMPRLSQRCPALFTSLGYMLCGISFSGNGMLELLALLLFVAAANFFVGFLLSFRHSVCYEMLLSAMNLTLILTLSIVSPGQFPIWHFVIYSTITALVCSSLLLLGRFSGKQALLSLLVGFGISAVAMIAIVTIIF